MSYGDLRSVSKARVVDALSEGEIEGPIDRFGNRITLNSQLGQCLFLDEAPLIDTSGQAAYQDIKTSFTQGRQGTLQSRDNFLSDNIYENQGVSVHLKPQNVWISPQIPTYVEQVRFTYAIPALFKRNLSTGNIEQNKITYTVKTGATSGDLKVVGEDTRSITGITQSNYARDETVFFNGANVRFISIERQNDEKFADNNNQSSFYLTNYAFIQNTAVAYSGTATFQMTFDAENLQSIPARAFRIRGIKVPLPVGYNGTKRLESFYDSIWDGSMDFGQDLVYYISFANTPTVESTETVYDVTLTNNHYNLDLGKKYNETTKTWVSDVGPPYTEVVHATSLYIQTSNLITYVINTTGTSTSQRLRPVGATIGKKFGNWRRRRSTPNNSDQSNFNTAAPAQWADYESGGIDMDTDVSITDVTLNINLLEAFWVLSANSASTVESGKAKIIKSGASVGVVTMQRADLQMVGLREGESYIITGRYKPSTAGGVTCNFFDSEDIALSAYHTSGPDGSGYYLYSFTRRKGHLDNFILNITCTDTQAAYFDWIRIDTTNTRKNIGWTNNPAWIFYDLITNQRYGLGKYLEGRFVDKWTLYQIAKYCDEKIDAGVGTMTIKPVAGAHNIASTTDPEVPVTIQLREQLNMQVSKIYPDQPITIEGYEYFFADYAYNGAVSIKLYDRDSNGGSYTFLGTESYSMTLVEPRFSINTYIQRSEDSYKVIQNLASAFRAMVYWAGGIVQLSQDAPRLPIVAFTNASVIDGKFEYATAARKARHTVAIVRYADERDLFKPKIESVEDGESLFKYGHRPIEISAFGATSVGQARRLGKWLLYTENKEAQTIIFRTALQGAYLKPGDVIKVMDKNMSNRYFGGRVVDIDVTTPSTPVLTLDKQWRQLNTFVYTFTAITPRGNKEAEEVNISTDIDDIRKSQMSTFTILNYDGADDAELGASDTYSYEGSNYSGRISAKVKLNGTLTDFDKIKKNTVWMVESANEISSEQYRILSIDEIKQNEFEIIGLKYIYDKFAEVETGEAHAPPKFADYPRVVAIKPVENLRAVLVDRLNGDYILKVSWTAPSGVFISHYLIRWEIGELGWNAKQRAENPSFDVPYTPLIGKYTVEVTAVATTTNRESISKQIVFGTNQTSVGYIQIAGGENDQYYDMLSLTLVGGSGPSGNEFAIQTPSFSWSREGLTNRMTIPPDPWSRNSKVITWDAHSLIYQETAYPIDADPVGIVDGEFINWTIGATAYSVTTIDLRENTFLQGTIIPILKNSDGQFDFLSSDKFNNLIWIQDKVNFIDFQVDVEITGSSVFTDYTKATSYKFDYDELYAAVTGTRDFDVSVRSRYLVHTGADDVPVGYLGLPTGISVSNPAPNIPSGIDIEPRGTMNELTFLNLDVDTVTDYAGNIVLVAATTGWDDLKANSKLESAFQNKVSVDATEKDLYYTVAHYDTWGRVGLNYSPWPAEKLVDVTPPNTPTGLTATKNENGLLLTWSHAGASLDIEGYEIWKCPNVSLQNFTNQTGQAQAGTLSSITFSAGTTGANDFYNNRSANITGGTGSGQIRTISDYNGATKVADVRDNWDTVPDNTSRYEILGNFDEIHTNPITLDDAEAQKVTYIVDEDVREFLVQGYNPANTEYYWIRAVDTTKNKSFFSPDVASGLEIAAETIDVFAPANNYSFIIDNNRNLISSPNYIEITGQTTNWPISHQTIQWFANAAVPIRGDPTTGNPAITTGDRDASVYVLWEDVEPLNIASFYVRGSKLYNRNISDARAFFVIENGASATYLDITSSSYTFSANASGTIIDPPYIVMDTAKQGVSDSVTWRISPTGILYENQIDDWNLERGAVSWTTGINSYIKTDGTNSYDGNNYIQFSNYTSDTEVYPPYTGTNLTGLAENDIIYMAARCKKPTSGTFDLFGPQIELRNSGETLISTVTGIMEDTPGDMGNNIWINIYGSYTITAGDITAGVDRARAQVAITNQSSHDFFVDSLIAFKIDENIGEVITEKSVVLYSGNFNVDTVEITATAT